MLRSDTLRNDQERWKIGNMINCPKRHDLKTKKPLYKTQFSILVILPNKTKSALIRLTACVEAY